jgi:hypothetical protein
MIHITPETPLSTPAVGGLTTTESGWKLDVSRYESFIETTTGMSVDGDLRAADCYRIGNRLEALITDHRHGGEWTEAVTERYPDVESREEIVGLARFFRECHDCCLDTADAGPPG